MRRLTGLCALNMGAFLTLFYTPVVSETRSRPRARSGRLTGGPAPTTTCLLVQTCDQYRMVNIISLILGDADGSATLL